MADEVVLLDFWPSPFGMRLRLALAMKGIEYEYKDEDLFNKSDLLLQMNPCYKKIPVLIHNGKPICESSIALQYIDEVWNDKSPLLPSDPYLRAQARFWADYGDKKVYDLGRKLWFLTNREEQAAAKKEFLEVLKALEGELGDKPYFGGESVGFLDVAMAPMFTWFVVFERFGEFSTDVEAPKLSAYFKRCLEIDVFAKTLPDQKRVYEFHSQLLNRLGRE